MVRNIFHLVFWQTRVIIECSFTPAASLLRSRQELELLHDEPRMKYKLCRSLGGSTRQFWRAIKVDLSDGEVGRRRKQSLPERRGFKGQHWVVAAVVVFLRQEVPILTNNNSEMSSTFRSENRMSLKKEHSAGLAVSLTTRQAGSAPHFKKTVDAACLIVLQLKKRCFGSLVLLIMPFFTTSILHSVYFGWRQILLYFCTPFWSPLPSSHRPKKTSWSTE